MATVLGLDFLVFVTSSLMPKRTGGSSGITSRKKMSECMAPSVLRWLPLAKSTGLTPDSPDSDSGWKAIQDHHGVLLNTVMTQTMNVECI